MNFSLDKEICFAVVHGIVLFKNKLYSSSSCVNNELDSLGEIIRNML